MINHYLKIAYRNLVRQKALAFINIAGLSIGIACFTLFLLYAVNEFSYDRFHANASTIYRMYDWWDFKGEKPRKGMEASSSTPLGPALKQDFPDVEEFVRYKNIGSQMMHTGGELQSIGMAYADAQILSVFSFPLLYGDPATALSGPSKVILTREKARQLFGEENPIGRTLNIKKDDKYETYIVSGVAKDIPVNSSIRFDVLGNFDYILTTDYGKESMTRWSMTIGIEVFVKLRKGSNLPNDQARLTAFYVKHRAEDISQLTKNGLWQSNAKASTGYGMQPLRDMHTNTTIDQGSVSPRNIWILICIAGGILIIACINFTTLAIGRSAGRAKEIGVRKVMGSMKGQLVRQFLAESFLLSILSTILGLLLAYFLSPFFAELSGTTLHFSFELFPEMAPLLIGLVLVIGLISGSYPALVLSSFGPIEVLKNKIRVSGSNIFTRSLVTFQFVLSIGLIIATAIILQQLSFMNTKDLGLNKDNVVVVDAGGSELEKIYPLFKQALQSNPSVLGVTASQIGLGAREGQMGRQYEYNDKQRHIIEYPVDGDYLQVMGVKLIAGRNFDPSISSDTINSVIINQSAVNFFFDSVPGNALGKQMKMGREGDALVTVIGVTRDFNFEDLTRETRPQLFKQAVRTKAAKFFVHIGGGDPSKALSSIGSTWKDLVPGIPFRYSFLDEKFARFYGAELRWSRIVGWAGGISIFLACLGLFGLAALAAVNRTKEIGVRKVMGATVSNIVQLLAKDFVKLVIIALVIATPIVWYFMNDWLQDYAYRITISWWVFVITGLVAIAVAVFTIGIQAIKTALINPVKSLRME